MFERSEFKKYPSGCSFLFYGCKSFGPFLFPEKDEDYSSQRMNSGVSTLGILLLAGRIRIA